MRLRMILNKVFALLIAGVGGAVLQAQELPAKRLSSIVGVAVEEYAKGIDARGRLISQQEYQETLDFLRDARSVAERLSGEQAPAARAVLDSILNAVTAKRPPAEVEAIHRRFVTALGSAGALELPNKPLDLAAGGAVYARNCASCH